MYRRTSQASKGQSLTEYIGSLVLTAMIVVITWQICHEAMPAVFTGISRNAANYYHTE